MLVIEDAVMLAFLEHAVVVVAEGADGRIGQATIQGGIFGETRDGKDDLL